MSREHAPTWEERVRDLDQTVLQESELSDALTAIQLKVLESLKEHFDDEVPDSVDALHVSSLPISEIDLAVDGRTELGEPDEATRRYRDIRTNILYRVNGLIGDSIVSADSKKESAQTSRDILVAALEKFPDFTHPEQRTSLNPGVEGAFDEAAQIIAHYWVGEDIEQGELLNAIKGGTNGAIGRRARHMAQVLTNYQSTERALVDAAIKCLFSTYQGKG